MKPAPFDYWRPDSIEHTVALLAELGDDAKVLAGGQSLVPMMNLRLARPAALVDIGAVPGLDNVTVVEHTVEVGSRVRHVDLERSSLPGTTGDLLRTTAMHIGHLPIRTRGTIGGSLAHADPAAEWCLAARTLDADIVLHGAERSRTVAADEFFAGYFTTAIQPEEILTGVRFPDLDDDHGVGFAEFSRRAGDFAIVAALCVLEIRDELILSARVGLAGVADRPVRAHRSEATLAGCAPSDDLFAAIATDAATEVDPPSDTQASADDRRDLIRALVRRALQKASAR